MEGYTAGNDVRKCSGAFRNKKARTGRASWSVSSHAGTCGNWYLVGRGDLNRLTNKLILKVIFCLRMYLEYRLEIRKYRIDDVEKTVGAELHPSCCTHLGHL
jgi:hypothetical protein